MLTKYGTSNIIVMLIISIFLMAGGIHLFNSSLSQYGFLYLLLSSVGLFLFTLTFIFFRDPRREVPLEVIDNINMVLSPADGKIVEIVEDKEDIYIKNKSIRISIFLSPLNVHVNRSPVTGIVDYFKFKPGKYLVAYEPESSMENQQTHIGMKVGDGKVFFKQIVGILARRLVWDISVGDHLNAGQRFGMMKFGSRMDIHLNPNSHIKVSVGDKVKAAETILAEIK